MPPVSEPSPVSEPVVTDPSRPEPVSDAITFEHVSKRWGDNIVLDDLNFEVGMGEKVSIIGPSGSGKTTILRIVMTLEVPDAGLVTVHGDTLWDARDGKPARETRQTRETRKRVGMVFQQFNLFPHMTAAQNIMEAPIRVLGMSKDQARQQAIDALEMVGMGSHVDHRPGRLSGGQQQRVAIARAMAMQPEVMLFDEPTSALDPELIGDVLSVIRDLATSTDMTMLLVTHEMRFAQEISDRVVMFDHGAAVEQAPPERLFSDPAEDRTRQFLRAVLDH